MALMEKSCFKNEKGDGKMKYKKFVELVVMYDEERHMNNFFKWLEEAIVVWGLEETIKFEIGNVEQGVNNDNLRPPK